MIKSQHVTVAQATESGPITVTTKDAGVIDAVLSVVSVDSAVTGLMGLGQRAALFAGGMAVQSKLKTNSFNFLK